MKQNIEYIEQLIERFFDGETSNAEEKEIYLFLTREDVPDHLFCYKSLFQYFESGIEYDIKRKPKPRGKRVWLVVTSIAASVAILLGVGVHFLNERSSFKDYEGSYIMRDGVVIYDLDLIKQRELDIQAQIDKQQSEISSLLNFIASEKSRYDELEELTKQ